MITFALVDLGDDVWVDGAEIAAVEPYRDVWGEKPEETLVVLKSGKRVRIRTNNVQAVLHLLQAAVVAINRQERAQ